MLENLCHARYRDRAHVLLLWFVDANRCVGYSCAVAVSIDVRRVQAVVLRRILAAWWLARTTQPDLAARAGVPLSRLKQHLGGHTAMAAYDIARYAHVYCLTESETVQLVQAAAMRDWSANPRGRPAPFDPPHTPSEPSCKSRP